MRFLVPLLLLLLFAPPIRAQDAPSAADRAAIAEVVTGQIEAFRRDDAATAFGYAAPGIQAMFGDADTFLGMVRRAYQPVYRPRTVRVGDVVVQGGQVIQRVELIGPDGAAELALYAMEREADGTWRIAGCQLTRSELIGT